MHVTTLGEHKLPVNLVHQQHVGYTIWCLAASLSLCSHAQSAMDPYRIVCYDLSAAAQQGKVGEPPLLVSRHGIAADMVLVRVGYWTGVCMCVSGGGGGAHGVKRLILSFFRIQWMLLCLCEGVLECQAGVC